MALCLAVLTLYLVLTEDSEVEHIKEYNMQIAMRLNKKNPNIVRAEP